MFGIVFCAVMIASAALSHSLLLVVIGFGVSAPLVYLAGKKSKEVGETIEDERMVHISQRSALWTYTIIAPLMGIAGAVLMVISSDVGDWAYYSSITLCLTLMVLVIVFMITYVTIDRRME